MGVEKKPGVRLEGQVQHFQPEGKKRLSELQPPVSSDLPPTSGAGEADVAGKNIKVPLLVFAGLATALHGIRNLNLKKLAEQNILGEIIRALFRRAGEGS